ncbi:MAG: hypothetical protein LBQ35_09125, partial [Spirochaetaceae bacterium]|nr:hypothetical protein [Spirochaetaceae bacterium]
MVEGRFFSLPRAAPGRLLPGLVLGLVLAFTAAPLRAQPASGEDPSVFIGFSLGELVEILGAPERVYAVR